VRELKKRNAAQVQNGDVSKTPGWVILIVIMVIGVVLRSASNSSNINRPNPPPANFNFPPPGNFKMPPLDPIPKQLQEQQQREFQKRLRELNEAGKKGKGGGQFPIPLQPQPNVDGVKRPERVQPPGRIEKKP
jgi:hypothetical protein